MSTAGRPKEFFVGEGLARREIVFDEELERAREHSTGYACRDPDKAPGVDVTAHLSTPADTLPGWRPRHSSIIRTLARQLLTERPVDAADLPDQRAYARLRARAGSGLLAGTADVLEIGQHVERVDFLPLDRLVSAEDLEAMSSAVLSVLATGRFTSGPHVEAFENEIAAYLGVQHLLGASSGTEALAAALLAVGAGPGAEVVLPANSFAATENSVLMTGAKPVLADVEPERLTLAPQAVAAAITERTRAVVPVHLYGRCADMDGLADVTDRAGVALVEDACQGIGLDGLGHRSAAAALSFNPYKNLGAAGKAGAVATDDSELAWRVEELLYHGFAPGRKNIKSVTFGMNARLDNLQAAVLRARLDGLALNNLARSLLAHRYHERLAGLERRGVVSLPPWDRDHVWHLFTVELLDRDRDDVAAALAERGVETDLYYPVLSHQHETDPPPAAAAELGTTELAHRRMLQLPLHPSLTLRELDYVTDAIVEVTR